MFFFCCSKCLSVVLSFAMWQTFALYISLFQASHYSSKQLVFFFGLFFFLFSVKWCLFIKAIDLLQCLNDPDLTHTPHKLYRLKINAQTIRGREMNGGISTQAQAAPGRAEPEPFGKVSLATFTCTPVVPVEVSTMLICLQEPLLPCDGSCL